MPFSFPGAAVGLLDTLDYDAVNTFITDFGEQIVYTPYGLAPITILAVINRQPASAIEGLNGAGVYKHEVLICNDPVAGVTQINKSTDTVSFANRVGGNPEIFNVMQVIQNDQGIWHLGVG